MVAGRVVVLLQRTFDGGSVVVGVVPTMMVAILPFVQQVIFEPLGLVGGLIVGLTSSGVSVGSPS